ncbi:hypothetical protein [Pseudomonas sp. 2FG]|uniref:hypothetical protein n=1 Tax=Pseudomonas sp. 2FG TaxID=2502191 RepID=UPI002113BEA9|nr:hypothetical protein [Pseudomonas sp. 2FG]
MGIRYGDIGGLGLGQFGTGGGQVGIDLGQQRLAFGQRRGLLGNGSLAFFQCCVLVGELLNRNADSLRKQHLKQLVQAGRLRLAFPTTPTHQMQAYRTTESE